MMELNLSRAADAVAFLRNSATIRARAESLMALAEDNRLDHFVYRPERLEAAAAYVAGEIKRNYADLNVPCHSRWRHFEVGGIDRWKALAPRIGDPLERVKARFDLAVTSVFVDAGAGAAWSYAEPSTGKSWSRSEGLAVASFDMFVAGRFSCASHQPWRADADGLAALTRDDVARGFQVGPDNPLVGLAGRTELMNGLARALRARPDLFGASVPRIGNLYDYLAASAVDG
ncbi:MAG: DUF1688 family protein, partial [Alphaproteobacteria bacterium]|nr:DUF1688 family protein [Alphaproteobacteria bacterium]